MTENQKNWLPVLGVMIVVVYLFGRPWLYSYEAMKVRVLDAATGQPVSGVHVVANWTLETSNPGGNHSVGQVNVLEAQTDNDGVAVIPAWGPRLILWGKPARYAPELQFYKPGYTSHITGNRDRRQLAQEDQQPAYWQFDEIKLVQLKERDKEKRLNVLVGASGRIITISMGNENQCLWINLPNILKEFNRERVRLKETGYWARDHLLADQTLLAMSSEMSNQCGEKGRLILEVLR